MNEDTLGGRIERILEIKGINKAKLADLLNVGRSRISQIVNNQNVPNFNFLEDFLGLFEDVSAEYICRGEKPILRKNLHNEKNTEQKVSSSEVSNEKILERIEEIESELQSLRENLSN